MSKLVNLDELVSVQRTITWQGKSYTVQDLSVREFVIAQKAVTAMSAAFEADDMEKAVDAAEKVIALAVPSFPKDGLAKLNMRQITATVSLIMDAYPDAGEEASAANAASGEPGKA